MYTTVDINGQTVFLSRYIRPQNPPPGIDTLQSISRYVSMIPVIPNRTAFLADCIIWCTSDQVLDIGAADFTEHAILLCNYLLQKQIDAFVVLGRGIPDGTMAYVLVRDEKVLSSSSLTNIKIDKDEKEEKGKSKAEKVKKPERYILINPLTGDICSLKDIHIPLKEIGCVFNAENVRCISFSIFRFGQMYKRMQISIESIFISMMNLAGNLSLDRSLQS
jgi:hypothetical protein